MFTFARPSQRPQAQQLMQPALIRVIDNLRKQLEVSSWRGEYREHLLWPATATTAEKQQVLALQAQLPEADPDTQAVIQQQLAQLPAPFPGYELHLKEAAGDGPPVAVIDVWQLCCCACFVDYQPEQPVVVDTELIETDGDIDWLRLDDKVQQLVAAVFPAPRAAADGSE